MSSILFIPFNNKPISTSVKSASYTIPSGKYAFVVPYFLNSKYMTTGSITYDICTIDSNIVLSGCVFSTQFSGGVSTAITSSVPARAKINIPFPGTPNAYDGLTIGNTRSIIVSGRNITAESVSFVPINQPQQYYVKTGTVLSGTGTFRWLVQEFNSSF